jgi:hypothetical protein
MRSRTTIAKRPALCVRERLKSEGSCRVKVLREYLNYPHLVIRSDLAIEIVINQNNPVVLKLASVKHVAC